MRNLLFCLLSIPFLTGCSKEITSLPKTGGQRVTLTVAIRPQQAEVVTKSTDENSVKDVNICLREKKTGATWRAYATGSSLTIQVPAGEYTLYALANLHRSLGEDAGDPLDFSFAYEPNSETLLMSGVQEISVPPGASSLTLPPVKVTRSVAKINYRVIVDPSVDLNVNFIQFCSLPRLICPFLPEKTLSPTDESYYTNRPPNVSATSGTIYMPANLQGQNVSIIDQQGKNSETAPSCATYILIKATRGAEVYTYTVYLGGNNTSDFNVCANTIYNLTIRILGTDKIDTRMSSYRVVIQETEESPLAGYVTGGSVVSGGINFEEAAPSDIFLIRFHSDQPLQFSSESASYDPYFQVSAKDGFRYTVNHSSGVIASQNSQVNYRIEVVDADGYSQEFVRDHVWCNELSVFTCYNQVGISPGRINVTGSLGQTEVVSSQHEYSIVGCTEEGVFLEAVPNEGYAFAGWYADGTYTKLLSSYVRYHYVPQKNSESIYARFRTPETIRIAANIHEVVFTCSEKYTVDQERECFIVPYGSQCTIRPMMQGYIHLGWWDTYASTGGNRLSTDEVYTFIATKDVILARRTSTPVRLDGNGTANCYIASALNTTYSFNGTVKGNNRATTNIIPSYHACFFARVLWETGTVRGAVVRTADADGRNVVFTTGNTWGSAVIGAFDKDSILQWSWHIWVTPFDPNATAQTIGGRTFMDRNLGAQNVTGTDAQGMFYQWGRKDPFVASTGGNGNTFMPTVYQAGYEYDWAGGRGTENTLAYSIKHPTHFILGLEYEDKFGGQSLGDWITPSNPNLWGNASDMAYSENSVKSIYDPSPPGWRVPDRKTWNEAAFSSGVYYNGGFTFAGKLYLPMCGVRSAGGGGITEPGNRGYYWTVDPKANYNNTVYALHLQHDGTRTDSQTTLRKSAGANIRCVKE